MDIEHTKSTKRTNLNKANNNKDLLRLQKPIFELKASSQNQSDYVIRKLMSQKQKPQIGNIGRSSLLSKLQQIMPIFKKSNQQILTKPIPENLKIDAKLQQCLSSDSQSESDQNNHQQHQSKQIKNKIKNINMDVQYQHQHQHQHELTKNISEEMEDQQNSLGQQLQINFLRYPYLTTEQLNQLQARQLFKNKQNDNKQKVQKKKPLIEEISEQSTK